VGDPATGVRTCEDNGTHRRIGIDVGDETVDGGYER
jgi:hypothetical protein